MRYVGSKQSVLKGTYMNQQSRAVLFILVCLCTSFFCSACDRDGKQTAPASNAPRTAYGEYVESAKQLDHKHAQRDAIVEEQADALLADDE
jgi:hypothetical protein